MKIFEYTPFDDVYVPYIKTPGLPERQKARIWEALSYQPLPFLTKWIIYRTFAGWR